MNENKKLMPEQFYSLDNNMSLDKIIRAQNTKEPLIGKVVMWNSNLMQLDVDLGNGFYGSVPIKLASLYPTLLPDGKLTPSVRALIGKTISLTVLSIDTLKEKPAITLSRKHNMIDAFSTISKSIEKDVECCVTSISKFGIFVDVGNGISGLIRYPDLCISRFHNPSDIGIKQGDKITAKILAVDEKFHVDLNYKDQFENLAFTLNTNDLIEATILEPINSFGYFAYLNPNTSAVVDVPLEVPCQYGDKVIARVKNPSQHKPDKVRLAFVSFV